jgi:pimeloyl-ACP methyl ester carboxylesterase
MAAQTAAIGAWGTVLLDDRYKALQAIKQTTLVVNGKHDLLVPTVNSYILQQHLPNATLIIYPDSGHGAIFQFADAFARETNRFLNT